MSVFGIPEGIPALILLVFTTPIGAILGTFLARSRAISDGQQKMAWLIALIGVESLTFWAWALRTCREEHFDTGILTFALVFLSGSLRYCALGKNDDGTVSRYCLPGSCGLICAHYFIGLMLVTTLWTKTLFSFIAGLWWLSAAFAALHFNTLVLEEHEACVTTCRRVPHFCKDTLAEDRAVGQVEVEMDQDEEQQSESPEPPSLRFGRHFDPANDHAPAAPQRGG